MFQNLRIRSRLSLLVIVFVVILIGLSALGLTQVNAVANTTTEVANTYLASIISLANTRATMIQLALKEKNAVLTSSSDTLALVNKEIQNQRGDIERLLDQDAPFMDTQLAQDKFSQLQTAWKDYLAVQ